MPVPLFSRRSVVLGLGGAAAMGTLPAQAAQKIVVAESQGYNWALPYLVSSRNFWKKYDIEAQTLGFTSGRLALDAVLAGKAQFGTTTDSPMALLGANGLRSMVVAEFSRISSGMVVAARSDRGISEPAALKGRRIATTLGTSGHYYLSRYLTLHKLTLKDVQVINLRAPDAVTALVRGDIDAFAWGLEAAENALGQAPDKVRILSNENIEKVFASHYILAATEEVVRQRPELVQAAVRALIDAETFYKTQHQSAVADVAARLKAPNEVVLKSLETVGVGVGLDDTLLDDLVLNGQWAIEAGLVKKDDQDLRALYRSLIWPDAMRTVAPERVKLT
ncbi:MAG: NrtA/SsuA/CpmA family ABC transporter substrate-binding protein [Pseudorhodoferax sp.]